MIKKVLISLIFGCFIMFQLNTVAFAMEGTGVDLKQIEEFSNKLQQKENYIPSFNVGEIVEKYKETGSIGVTFKDVLASLGKFILKEVVANSRLLVELLVLGILSAILQNIQNAFNNSGISKIAHYACFCTIVIIIVKSFTIVINLAKGTIDQMTEFASILIPPLIMLIATTGQVISAATLDPITILILSVSSSVIKNFIIPCTTFVVVLNIVNSLSDEPKVMRLASLIKQISLWALGFIMTIFITLITIRSNTAATIDQVTLKTTKFFVDNFIPLVGKSLSDAITTVVGYSLVLKDAISILGLLIMIWICIFPLLKIIMISLIYKFVGAVMEPVVDKKIINCLSSVGSSFTVIFSSVLCTAIMFFIMITIITSTGRLIMTVG
ncbi:stage III sporulation protein AE [Clostridium cylindrosporum]|uniref:Stage III sporulation protein AE n=1 Tax=Clostridium cylindrosporum DSM 605 TaxID=1121307 RepID=A0A0J8DAL1_CLOCY|nr:stage III sporulation protein AE [Clostridium cylindrosporum]KMT21343.1 stage III sporulation protein AE [Clostridium cylindrosporum DSM 605]